MADKEIADYYNAEDITINYNPRDYNVVDFTKAFDALRIEIRLANVDDPENPHQFTLGHALKCVNAVEVNDPTAIVAVALLLSRKLSLMSQSDMTRHAYNIATIYEFTKSAFDAARGADR